MPERRFPVAEGYLSPEIRPGCLIGSAACGSPLPRARRFRRCQMHTGDGYVDDRGMYAQIHNVLCFYFQDDTNLNISRGPLPRWGGVRGSC